MGSRSSATHRRRRRARRARSGRAQPASRSGWRPSHEPRRRADAALLVTKRVRSASSDATDCSRCSPSPPAHATWMMQPPRVAAGPHRTGALGSRDVASPLWRRAASASRTTSSVRPRRTMFPTTWRAGSTGGWRSSSRATPARTSRCCGRRWSTGARAVSPPSTWRSASPARRAGRCSAPRASSCSPPSPTTTSRRTRRSSRRRARPPRVEPRPPRGRARPLAARRAPRARPARARRGAARGREGLLRARPRRRGT